MQPGERQLHLRLHARRPRHPAPRRAPGQVVHQRGLAHPRLTADHQHPAPARPYRVNELIQRRALCRPIQQLWHQSRIVLATGCPGRVSPPTIWPLALVDRRPIFFLDLPVAAMAVRILTRVARSPRGEVPSDDSIIAQVANEHAKTPGR